MKKLLKVLGWICIPYIMIFVFWKRLEKRGRIAGIIYSVVILISAIVNGNSGGNTEKQTTQPATTVASTASATTDTNTVENSKTEAQQKADEAAAAQKKAQEEAAAKAKADADAKAKAQQAADEAAAKKAQADAIAQAQAAARTNAKSIEYAQLKKDPNKYSGQYAKYTGEIVQILEDGNNTVIRLAVTKDDFGYNFGDIVFVKYQGTTDYVEKDIVTVYGTLDGSYTYKSQAGWDISVPSMSADFFDKVGTAQN